MNALHFEASSGMVEQSLQTALDEIAFDVMLVDAEGVLLFANRSAQREIASGATFALDGGRLTTALDGQRSTWLHALRSARLGGRSMIEVGARQRARMHAVIPLPGASDTHGLQVLLLSGVRQPFCPVALTLFAKVAGLTSSERDVLISLCGGRAAEEIAAERAVQITTVRTQIRSIREKVGARTVTQVIRIVSSLPPMSLV